MKKIDLADVPPLPDAPLPPGGQIVLKVTHYRLWPYEAILVCLILWLGWIALLSITSSHIVDYAGGPYLQAWKDHFPWIFKERSDALWGFCNFGLILLTSVLVVLPHERLHAIAIPNFRNRALLVKTKFRPACSWMGALSRWGHRRHALCPFVVTGMIPFALGWFIGGPIGIWLLVTGVVGSVASANDICVAAWVLLFARKATHFYSAKGQLGAMWY